MVTDGVAIGPVGASRGYVGPARDQVFLLPVCMLDWVAGDHLAWWVIEAVRLLDTGGLHRRPGGAPGRRPYCPEMMCALVLYGYCTGVRSSRRIEAACRTDAAFRVVCGGLAPDHATIARFVVDHERTLEDLFADGLRLCAEAGLVDLSVVALDGTKMAADASIDRNRDAGWIRREVAKLLAVTAADGGAAPQPLDGEAPPAAPGGARGRRLARLQAALAVIEAEDEAERERAREKGQALAEDARRGRAPHGRPPKDPLVALERAQAAHEAALAREQAEGTATARRRVRKARAALEQAEQRARVHAGEPALARRANVTDPDSRIMNTHNGWVQGYNAQAIASASGIVLACQVSQSAADTPLYAPMTDTLASTLAAAGVTDAVGLVLADAGYWSHDNAAAPGPDRLIATTSGHKQRQAARQLGPASGPPPDGATPEQAMEHRLRAPHGAATYKLRSCTIEPVFGERKHNRAMRGFRRRGLPAAQSEWALMNLAHNLLKLREHRTANATA
jgi:transposase